MKSKTSFAIVVDQETYQQVKKEIDAYRTAVEQSGLGTYIVAGNFANPGELRKLLKELYARPQQLEGAVLVGDIPIAMVRDAQYLTSTFKMNQKINWQRSSVPSDRFYDDFGLEFDFIKQDTARKDYFYYSISPDGAQQIHMNIYTARIKPPVIAGKTKYQLIGEYLVKAVNEKKQQNKIDDVFISTAHGYNSESINSQTGELLAFRSQFPDLFTPNHQVKVFSFQNDPALKFSLLSALKQPQTDIAIMHGHGDTDVQLINGYPYVSAPAPSIENITRYLRSKIQAAKEDGRDVQKAKQGFVEWLGVPMAWMDNALDPEVIKQDSLFIRNQDIHIDDILNTKPNARFVMLDNCLTGSFHLDEYIAGYYPFSGGRNIVAVANSIGVLQDLWPDQLMGIMQHGARMGNWFKHVAYLETHMMGDPTFAFARNSNSPDVNAAITVKQPVSYWKALLQKPDADLRALALIYLGAQMDARAYSELLKNAYFTSPYETTRMQAFSQLEKLDNADFLAVLKAATTDPYEFIRRRALYEITEDGGDQFVAPVVNMIVNDYHSERIAFKLRGVLTFINADLALQEINKQINDSTMVHFAATRAELEKSIRANEKKVKEMIDTILDNSKTDKVRLFEITTMRAYRYHQTVPALVTVVKDAKSSEALRLAALEALSWFPRSWRKAEIVTLCKEIGADNNYSVELKKQARKNLRLFM
ncbi:HEAT repeat domain-containing protein [Chitinophaga horti]|uniref:HEAT repeat domain-containing protein n=1 Tax=Chitinophaga horti TaxID=2920382 RepID=A0ABY6J837_9BACT|nr:HEAT repeat domain-containing protein [Chitinophaga horti]UYQ94472.1 HEAT repeat domain-containing protein [Chitinophaga horti]